MITFYKPNAKVTGAGCSFYVNDQGEFFATFIKQKTAPSNGRAASFDQNKKAIMKLSPTEIAGFINAILRKTEAKGYHQSPKQVVTFSMAASTGEYAGKFTWQATFTAKDDSTNKSSFFVTLEASEAMLLLEHFRYLLQRHWSITDKKYENKNFGKEEASRQKANKPQEDDDLEW
tara:strand:+ start:320 stop:844 length:525 start_codon:yes stop_codon:yes gene_type:complete